MNKFVIGALAAAASALIPMAASANHLLAIPSVDAIDFTFGAGGGSFSSSLAGGGDDGWYVFNAAAGDAVTISHVMPGGDATLVLFQAIGNGVVDVGDTTGCGTGTFSSFCGPGDLSWVAYNDDFGSLNSFISLTIAATGQYAIAASSFNDGSSGGYTITLTGNSIGFVPAPGAIALLGFGLLGLSIRRRSA